MQDSGDIRRPSTRNPSRENRGLGRGISALERDLPHTLAYPFANQLEAWKENARARSGAKANNHATEPKPSKKTHRSTTSQGDRAFYDGGKHGKDADNQETADNGSYPSASAEEQEQQSWKGRAWNSGSLLVRAGGEPPSGRVPRMTYIYLVGNARTEDGVEVEVVVGAEKERTVVLSKSSGVTRARVPAREKYTVRNLSEDGKTAVLFWTSPSGGVDEQDATEQPRETGKKGRKHEVGVEQMPQPLERLPIATRNAFAAPMEGIFTSEDYGKE